MTDNLYRFPAPAQSAESHHGELVQALEMALVDCGFSRNRAAKRMGVARSTLRRQLNGTHRVDVETILQDPVLAAAFVRRLGELVGVSEREAA